MSRYIDVDILKRVTDNFAFLRTGDDYDSGYNDCMSMVENTVNVYSTADVAEVKHGKWMLEREPNGKPYCYHCSVCDDDYHFIGIKTQYRYCPNCGAKMDGGKSNA